MNEWGIFVVVATVVGFIITVSTPITKLTKSITELNCNITSLDEKFEEIAKRTTANDEKVWKKIDTHEQRITENEKKLAVMSAEKRKE